MKCTDCKFAACLTFVAKTEVWSAFCMNSESQRYHTMIEDASGCNITTQIELFND